MRYWLERIPKLWIEVEKIVGKQFAPSNLHVILACKISLFFSVLLFTVFTAAAAQGGEWRRCERVVDGDTVWVTGIGKVRLIGVDTPELGGVGREAEPGASRAKEFVIKLIEGKPVLLKFDEERYDSYGRTLAYIYTEGGESVGELLLAAGLAEPIFYFPYRMKARYLDLWRSRKLNP